MGTGGKDQRQKQGNGSESGSQGTNRGQGWGENGLGREAGLSEKELRQLNKQKEAEERRQRRLAQELENKIAAYEEEISLLEEKMADPQNSTDYQLLAGHGEELVNLMNLLNQAYSS